MQARTVTSPSDPNRTRVCSLLCALAALAQFLPGPAFAFELDPGGEVRFNIGTFRPWTFYDSREDDDRIDADKDGVLRGSIISDLRCRNVLVPTLS